MSKFLAWFAGDLVWWIWWGWFIVWETVGIVYMFGHNRNDKLTATHFIATHIPLALRVAILAWLVYHFIWQHPKG